MKKNNFKLKRIDNINLYYFEDHDQLIKNLANKFLKIINKSSINRKSRICLSGGTSPLMLYEYISCMQINWKKIQIILTDERIVSLNSRKSNLNTIKKIFLNNTKTLPNFIALKSLDKKNVIRIRNAIPFDLILLGMGEDGHTASIFPSKNLKNLNLKNLEKELLISQKKDESFKRISLSGSSLKKSKNHFLLLRGKKKLITLNKAIKTKSSDKYPINAFLRNKINVYWSPN